MKQDDSPTARVLRRNYSAETLREVLRYTLRHQVSGAVCQFTLCGIGIVEIRVWYDAVFASSADLFFKMETGIAQEGTRDRAILATCAQFFSETAGLRLIVDIEHDEIFWKVGGGFKGEDDWGS